MLVAIFGLIVTAVLLVRKVPGAILIGILVSTIGAIVTRAPVYFGPKGAMVPFGGFTDGLVSLPTAPSGLIGALDLHAALSLGVATVVFTFFFVDFFDATGTLVALANKAGALDANGNMPRSRRTFACDGLAAICGAFLGTSTTTAYIESASGIEEGGRTGLVAVTVGALFIVAMFFWPLAGRDPRCSHGTRADRRRRDDARRPCVPIEWDDYAILISGFLTIVMMPLTFSIANGVSFGVISYALIKLLSGRGKDVDILLYLVAAALIARYIWLGG